ncbi:MAG: Lrp/AsnC family transcriptional regulator [Candidatus Burarchaeum sp.]|nr:Lrp/AsnC family transcriptional regulator [Candidatus Burarchaeum sp.]MDO8340212.1 Lrp/AsnC family transcriptional regulator [Candidatus Burarchaeum sp.]
MVEVQGQGLDVKDRWLLYALDRNARQPLAALGRAAKVSKQVAAYRLQGLIERGIVKGFITVPNVSKFGYKSHKLLLRFQNLGPEKEGELIRYLVKHPAVGWLVRCVGRWDVVLVVWSKNDLDFATFLQELENKYGAYILERDISVMLSVHYYFRSYLVGRERRETDYFLLEGVPQGEFKTDETDVKLVQLLSQNARASLAELAEKLGMTGPAVNYRLRRLLKEGAILGFRPSLNLPVLGYQYYKVFFRMQNLTAKREIELFRYFGQHPNITYATRSIGASNVEIEVEIEDALKFNALLMDLRKQFADIVRDYDSLLIYEEYKHGHMPG